MLRLSRVQVIGDCQLGTSVKKRNKFSDLLLIQLDYLGIFVYIFAKPLHKPKELKSTHWLLISMETHCDYKF